jgi:NAD(P)-dependent dehydrogenase (short-subunit alcohol dehydrogenase family)
MQPTILPARPSLHRSLAGQRVVIIGGTSGFGMATAKAASAEGASVIVASSKKTNVDRALAELPAGAEGHVLDVTRESAVTNFFSTIGEFNHLAVKAGESLDLGEFATVDLEKARRFFR